MLDCIHLTVAVVGNVVFKKSFKKNCMDNFSNIIDISRNAENVALYKISYFKIMHVVAFLEFLKLL